MGTRRVLVATVAAVAALSGCSAAGDVDTLAKVDGWPAGADAGLLQVAYDEETAARLWADTVSDDLPARSGRPTDPGRYGELADVDLETHVVALWSGVQSSSCPSWADSVHVDAAGSVVVTEETTGGECTADADPYRQVVAVPRDQVPEADRLPSVADDSPGSASATVVEYGAPLP